MPGGTWQVIIRLELELSHRVCTAKKLIFQVNCCLFQFSEGGQSISALGSDAASLFPGNSYCTFPASYQISLCCLLQSSPFGCRRAWEATIVPKQPAISVKSSVPPHPSPPTAPPHFTQPISLRRTHFSSIMYQVTLRSPACPRKVAFILASESD